MPNSRSDFTYEDYLQAKLTIATIEADTWWRQNRANGKPVEKPVAVETSKWLKYREVLKFLGFGETKFRALRKEGKMPEGEMFAGELRWKRTEIERALEQLRKPKGVG